MHELVVVAVEARRALERFDGALELEGGERLPRLLEETQELLLPRAVVEGEDAFAQALEAVALLERQEPLVAAAAPEQLPLFARYQLLAFEQLAHGGEAGLGHGEVLFLLLHHPEQVLDGLGRALDRLLEQRDALEQVLVEGEVLLELGEQVVALVAAAPRHHQQLVVAAAAELLVVGIAGAAGLAVDGVRRSALDHRVCARGQLELYS